MIISDTVDICLAEERRVHELERLTNQREGYFWPTECSVPYELTPGVLTNVGGCRRKVFYRWRKVEPTNPTQPKSIRRMEMGTIIELQERDWYRKFGIAVAEKVKFQDHVRRVSGECDCLVFDPEVGIIGVEIKSYYGYKAERDIEGLKSKPGFPRLDNLLQAMMYIFETKLPAFHLVYINRGSTLKTEFNVTLNGQGFPVVSNMHRPYTTTFTGFSVYDVFPRMDTLAEMILRDELPARDFQEAYPADEIEARYACGDISKTAYESWSKSREPIGDWQCFPDYCAYYDLCSREARSA